MSEESVGSETDRSPLTEIEERILGIFRADSRISMSELAKAVGISRSNAYARVESLIERGVILGFHTQVDAAHVGLNASAFVLLNVRANAWAEFREAIATVPEVEYACIATGDFDVMMLVRSVTVQDIHVLVAGVLATMPSVRAVKTVVVLDELVRRPFLLTSDLPDRSGTREELAVGRVTRGPVDSEG